MSKRDAVRKMTQGQLVDIMQAIMHAIPDITFYEAYLLGSNKKQLKKIIKKGVVDLSKELQLQKLFSFRNSVFVSWRGPFNIEKDFIEKYGPYNYTPTDLEDVFCEVEGSVKPAWMKVYRLAKESFCARKNRDGGDGFVSLLGEKAITPICHMVEFLEQNPSGDYIFCIEGKDKELLIVWTETSIHCGRKINIDSVNTLDSSEDGGEFSEGCQFVAHEYVK